MRYVALLVPTILLSGCGYRTWSDVPFTGASNPNLPAGDSENMQRVEGRGGGVAPLTPEAGDIWPNQLKPPPTLEDFEKTGNLTPQTEAPVPGSPLSRGMEGPGPSPNPSTGSSTVPGNAQPGLPPLPASPGPATARQAPARVAPNQTGRVIQTPQGPNVITGGTPNYQTTTTPGGGQSIIVPNGNGTSTVIHSDGRVETIPTPAQ
jgi:hypothetical protein